LQCEEDLIFGIQAGDVRVIAVDTQNISATVCVYQIDGIVGSLGEWGNPLRSGSECWPHANKRRDIQSENSWTFVTLQG
jgi:hypothetical protein